MTEQRLQAEYSELVSSGLRAPLLVQCFYGKLAVVASRQFGGQEAAAKFLGVFRTTISRWNCDGRELPVSEELQLVVKRIAQALLDREIVRRQEAEASATGSGEAALPATETPRIARHMADMFDAALVAAAVDKADGRKGKAAKLLGVHRNWVVVHTKVRRFA